MPADYFVLTMEHRCTQFDKFITLENTFSGKWSYVIFSQDTYCTPFPGSGLTQFKSDVYPLNFMLWTSQDISMKLLLAIYKMNCFQHQIVKTVTWGIRKMAMKGFLSYRVTSEWERCDLPLIFSPFHNSNSLTGTKFALIMCTATLLS